MPRAGGERPAGIHRAAPARRHNRGGPEEWGFVRAMTTHGYPSQPAGGMLSPASPTPAVEPIAPRLFLPLLSRLSMTAHPLAARRVAAAGLAALAVGAGALLLGERSASDTGPRQTPPAVAIDPDLTRVATPRLPLVDVHANPTSGVVIETLEHPTRAGTPLVFLVEGDWEDWFKVQLPTAPGGAEGWIRADTVDIEEHRVRLTIDLDKHMLVAYERGRPVLQARVAVGEQDQPDAGTTFVTQRLTLPNTSVGYGRLALPLAGYGNGPETLFRGQGLVAVHGTSEPIKAGQTTADGSVALSNDDMAALYELAPVGTPVDVLRSESSPR